MMAPHGVEPDPVKDRASGRVMMSSQVISAQITPECRMNRGVDGAWDEAVERLRVEYLAVCAGWKDKQKQPTLNLLLTMDR
jgi:hypothetical protein